MKKLNLTRKGESNSFGMPLESYQEAYIKKRLYELQEKCPANSKVDLKLEKRKSCIKGTLRVQNFSDHFFSYKVASEPIQTFLLLEEDIEAQLLEWKRVRFSNSLHRQLSKKYQRFERTA